MDQSDYDRVTEIIAPFSGVEFVPEDILRPAADKGTLVHKFIESYFNKEDVFNEPEEVIPYMKSFREFWERSEHIFHGGEIQKEVRFYCDDLKITGQMDLIIEMKGRVYLIDWKTSSREHISWRLQGAAYRYLVEKSGRECVDNVLFVNLKKDKKPALYKYESYEDDIKLFKNCLEIYRFFDMKKTRRKNYEVFPKRANQRAGDSVEQVSRRDSEHTEKLYRFDSN